MITFKLSDGPLSFQTNLNSLNASYNKKLMSSHSRLQTKQATCSLTIEKIEHRHQFEFNCNNTMYHMRKLQFLYELRMCLRRDACLTCLLKTIKLKKYYRFLFYSKIIKLTMKFQAKNWGATDRCANEYVVGLRTLLDNIWTRCFGGRLTSEYQYQRVPE